MFFSRETDFPLLLEISTVPVVFVSRMTDAVSAARAGEARLVRRTRASRRDRIFMYRFILHILLLW